MATVGVKRLKPRFLTLLRWHQKTYKTGLSKFRNDFFTDSSWPSPSVSSLLTT